MYLTDGWQDYEIIDAGNGEKLERWGDVVLLRPDPQAIWPMKQAEHGLLTEGCPKAGLSHTGI